MRYNNLDIANDPHGNFKKFKKLKSLIIKIKSEKSYILEFNDIFNFLSKYIKKLFLLLKKILNLEIKISLI